MTGTGAVLGLIFAVSAKQWRGRPITGFERIVVFLVPTAFAGVAGLGLVGAIELHGAASVVCLFLAGGSLGAFYGLLQYQRDRRLHRIVLPTLVMGFAMLALLSSTLRESGQAISALGSLVFLAVSIITRRRRRAAQDQVPSS